MSGSLHPEASEAAVDTGVGQWQRQAGALSSAVGSGLWSVAEERGTTSLPANGNAVMVPDPESGLKGSISPYHFKLQLATYITPDTSIYKELEACIFCGS